MTKELFTVNSTDLTVRLVNTKENYGFGFPNVDAFEEDLDEELEKFCKELNKSYSKLEKENNELKLTSNLFSDRELKRLKKENASLKFENRNANYVLNDFMNMLNRIQYYFSDDIELTDLDHKDLNELKKLANQSRDMLRLMDMDLKK